MSADIREYESIDLGYGSGTMRVTAFAAGEYGNGVQFTMTDGNIYCSLGEKAIRDLIKTLENRLACKKHYSATGDDNPKLMFKQAPMKKRGRK